MSRLNAVAVSHLASEEAIMNMHFFDLFGLNAKYSVDVEALTEKYFTLQKRHHPDKAISPEDHEKKLALSMMINKAYKTLSDPLARAEYMLAEYDKSVLHEASRYQLNASDLEYFLTEQENIDSAGVTEELAVKLEQYKEDYTKCVKNIDKALSTYQFDKAQYLTCYLKYLQNLVAYTTNKMQTSCK